MNYEESPNRKEIPSVNDRLKEKEEELKIKQEAKLKKVNKICR